MFSLIILIAFGLGVAYFATQNTGVVHINLANYFIEGVPLYVIVIGSMLLGIFVSWLISLVNSISSMLRIHGKEAELKEAYHTIDSLKKDNEALLQENRHLKKDQQSPYEQNENKENTHEEPVVRPSFFNRLRHSFT